MNLNIYIDGFNLYYCAVKGTMYKWLDLNALANNLFPGNNIKKIRYFSAKVKATQHDPGAPTRQDTYWRALKTLPNLEITEGHFVRWPKIMPQYPLVYVFNNFTKPPLRVQVESTNEKGSDVNLAAYLIYENCTQHQNPADSFDEAIVISNDSDLAHSIELVTTKLHRHVTVVNPNTTHKAQKYSGCRIQQELKRVATNFYPSINERLLISSQFSPTLTDSQGSFTKPATW